MLGSMGLLRTISSHLWFKKNLKLGTASKNRNRFGSLKRFSIFSVLSNRGLKKLLEVTPRFPDCTELSASLVRRQNILRNIYFKYMPKKYDKEYMTKHICRIYVLNSPPWNRCPHYLPPYAPRSTFLVTPFTQKLQTDLKRRDYPNCKINWIIERNRENCGVEPV